MDTPYELQSGLGLDSSRWAGLNTAMGCMFAQEEDKGVERDIYYLNKKMVGYELNYTPLEKTCWVLAWARKRL